MVELDSLTKGMRVAGIHPDGPVTVEAVTWVGSAVNLIFTDAGGAVGSQLVYPADAGELEVVEQAQQWRFDGDGEAFRLASEALRIHLGYLFDPMVAVHSSDVEPLPHQITAVYEAMLPRQPLRFLLADDPGSGKTIMAGLLIKELMIRGDVERCLIVCPGSLVEQWQDELREKFGLHFDILTRDKAEASVTGNWFTEVDRALCRLDMLSRNEHYQEQLRQTDWDLIVVDEAHKMSASYFGGEVKRTMRHELGRLLRGTTRHFLLMTATPHNGKEEDFQLFMQLIDPDRFEGQYRPGDHQQDATDLMRRMVKEELVRFDATPLFPERRANSVDYPLSPTERDLYEAVTRYVREEFSRADQLEGNRKGTVGFALTVLQRRLASSPEAIWQSLRRRRERLLQRIEEIKSGKPADELLDPVVLDMRLLTAEDIEDLDDAPDAEVEEIEDLVLDAATAARTIAELEAEVQTLEVLERQALDVRNSGHDAKWEQLSDLLQQEDEMFDLAGNRRKLVIFTEHRDTLNYLAARIRTVLGRPEAVVTIQGGMHREERRKMQNLFTQNPNVVVLVATDAAGEGINLQRAHLMVNYDLPWNPNRLEQRFGRIHRIGQREVCHLWNLVAEETREGHVFRRLLDKIEQEREALGGKVFDVLGQLDFDRRPLRDLLLRAIRYGDDPEIRAKLDQVIDDAVDREHLEELLSQHALAHETMTSVKVQEIRRDMERAEARKLQPHFIGSFFVAALRDLGGRVYERETGRWEVSRVPGVVKQRGKAIAPRQPVVNRYERIVFDRKLVAPAGKPLGEFVCPGHPLLDATIDAIIQRYGSVLKAGAVLVDASLERDTPRALFFVEHDIHDASTDARGQRGLVSRQIQFVELMPDGSARNAGYAPHLDYRPLSGEERDQVENMLGDEWLGGDLEQLALAYAVEELVPEHKRVVTERRLATVDRTLRAVKQRLTAEIMYWDRRAEELKAKELAGKKPRLNSAKARQRSEALRERLEQRTRQLQQERQLASQMPKVIGGALVIPEHMLSPEPLDEPPEDARKRYELRRLVELAGMRAVMEVERQLGNEPRDVSKDDLGYDIESLDGESGKLRFIEVKGKVVGKPTVTITRNELIAGLNKPEEWILAIALVPADEMEKAARGVAEGRRSYVVAPLSEVRYQTVPIDREPGFAETSVNFDLPRLLSQAHRPLPSSDPMD